MTFLFSLLLSLLIIAAPAQAQAPTCIPIAQAMEYVNAAIPITHSIRLNSDQATRAVHWFNAQPPISENSYDMAIIIGHAGNRIGLLVGNGDKVCAILKVEQHDIAALMDAIRDTAL